MAAHYNFLKRKATGTVDQISHDFSDFSLSSPATKIRRLDAELTPIVEEEEEENEPLTVSNDERAIVLFKPSLHSSPSFSLTLNSDLISGIKNNQVSWSKQCDDYYDNLIEQNDNKDRRLAIVPWVPQSSSGSSSHTFDDDGDDDNNENTIELMEADVMGEEKEDEEDEGAMMDVEEQQQRHNDSSCFNSSGFNYPPTMVEGFQQHCLFPQIIPQNTSTPITWTR
ncbi:uncharacterized protein LOC131608123 [Vicia villosa]|uniref:uncharacterized protein LOC131608123 n=1 Tax=Vicia villosa TaxID=3911 RepID=UPI00273CEF90|nr:uncharacterized protein LOC131608123 [Vicia villosa]